MEDLGNIITTILLIPVMVVIFIIVAIAYMIWIIASAIHSTISYLVNKNNRRRGSKLL